MRLLHTALPLIVAYCTHHTDGSAPHLALRITSPDQYPASNLTNPLTRFSNLTLELPVCADAPSVCLQTNFPASRPDAGEESYVGSGRLAGRKALITGGDSGIGRAVAIAFAREGAQVAINYLPEEEPDADDLEQVLRTGGFNLTKILGDLLNETFCEELIRTAYDRLGGLDALVLNAGYSGPLSDPLNQPISNFSTAHFDRILRTNLYANFFLTRAAVPLLPPGASIIFTSSDVAANPLPNAPVYSASKAFLSNLTRGLALALATAGIRVNALAPGFVYTPFIATGGFKTSAMLETAALSPIPRMQQPVELAPLYVDLADSANSFGTSSIWGANGGTGGY